MKTCLSCGIVAERDVASCIACGEASWRWWDEPKPFEAEVSPSSPVPEEAAPDKHHKFTSRKGGNR